MRIDTIYLDLDDVCNTFTPYLLNRMGCAIEPHDYGGYPGKLDIVPAANLLGLVRNWTRKSFWEAVGREMWVQAPVSNEFHWLLKTCRHYVGHDIYVATSPTKDPDCLAGKLEWIHEHMPKWMHRQYFITPRKWMLGRPGALLVDDNEKNCRKFEERGGLAIRFPRPWNTAARHEPLAYLKTEFGKLTPA